MRVAKVAYASTVLVAAVLLAHVYWNVTFLPYWDYSTEYEMVGRIAIVSCMSLGMTIPVLLLGIVGISSHPSNVPLAVLDGVVSVGVCCALIVGIITQCIPWDQWDRNGVVVVAMVTGAGALSAVCGHATRRVMASVLRRK